MIHGHCGGVVVPLNDDWAMCVKCGDSTFPLRVTHTTCPTTDDVVRGYRAHIAALTSARHVLRAQLDAANAAISAECVEHVELNGHIDNATFAHDYLLGERDKGDPSGRLHDFVASLEVVIDQCDKQRRRANWYEAAHTAGKAKLIEHATATLTTERDAARAEVERLRAAALSEADRELLRWANWMCGGCVMSNVTPETWRTVAPLVRELLHRLTAKEM
jgi:hypothetical protein